ncbi:hypothetical protein CRENBAI_016060, partial [Crenichthys baileyi]
MRVRQAPLLPLRVRQALPQMVRQVFAIGRHGLYASAGVHVCVVGLHSFAADRPGLCIAAPAHVTEGPGDGSAPVPSLQAFQGFREQLVHVLASEPRDEGFEEEAPSNPVPEGFKEQFVLVLASEPRDEGSPGATSASKGSPDTASEGSPEMKVRQAPPQRVRQVFAIDRHGLYASAGLHVFVVSVHGFAADRQGLCVA